MQEALKTVKVQEEQLKVQEARLKEQEVKLSTFDSLSQLKACEGGGGGRSEATSGGGKCGIPGEGGGDEEA